jgi:hypothetical protein
MRITRKTTMMKVVVTMAALMVTKVIMMKRW